MYQYSRQTKRRTKGTLNAWQNTAWVPFKKKPKQPRRKIEKSLKDKIKDEFGVTITKPSADWLNIKLQQNRIKSA